MMTIRDMHAQDIPDVLEIEQLAYEHPSWTEGLLKQAQSSSKYTVVIEQQSTIVGYGIVSYVVGEAELLNICITPAYQGQGLSKVLLGHLIEHAQKSDNTDMYLEVRASNKPAISLYEHFGFNEIGIRKGYYPANGGREDAILMALPLSL